MALNNEVSILNIANIDNDIKDASTRGMIAAEEKMEYATRNYDVNEYFIWNDRKLYKTKQAIGVGNNFVIDVNVKYIGNIASQLYDLYSQSPDTIREIISNVELANNASKAYAAGKYVIRNDGFLYRLIRDVDLGTLWNVGYNIQKVDNVTALINELDYKTNVTRTFVAPLQSTNKAERTYNVGDQFIYNNVLYRATSQIALNATITPGGNCATAGSVSTQINNLNSSKLGLTGGTITGHLVYKRSDIDATRANNNVSEIVYPTSFDIKDVGDRDLVRLDAVIRPNGDIASHWAVKNYDANGTLVASNGLTMAMDKNGEIYYVVDNPSAFRAAIASVNKAGDTFTGSVYAPYLRIERNVGEGSLCLNVQTKGTTTTTGTAQVQLGNEIAEGKANNSFGQLVFYSLGTSFIALMAQTTNTSRYLYLPTTGTALATAASSSYRVKENIRDITEEEALKILNVNVVKFDYKEGFEDGLKNQTGVIAEEVKEIIPEVVSISESYDETKPIDPARNPSPTVDYGKFAPYLIKMVQMQQERIEKLERIIEELKG